MPAFLFKSAFNAILRWHAIRANHMANWAESTVAGHKICAFDWSTEQVWKNSIGLVCEQEIGKKKKVDTTAETVHRIKKQKPGRISVGWTQQKMNEAQLRNIYELWIYAKLPIWISKTL